MCARQLRTNSRFAGQVNTEMKRGIEGIRVKHRVEENSTRMHIIKHPLNTRVMPQKILRDGAEPQQEGEVSNTRLNLTSETALILVAAEGRSKPI